MYLVFVFGKASCNYSRTELVLVLVLALGVAGDIVDTKCLIEMSKPLRRSNSQPSSSVTVIATIKTRNINMLSLLRLLHTFLGQ